jgi:hypothetical protein
LNNTQIATLTKIHPVGAKFSHVDGQTDDKHHEANVALQNSSKLPRNKLK